MNKLKKEVAPTATLGIMIADISAKMDSKVMIKPAVINCDNGSAFISQHFREFLADRQIQLRFSPPYTPQLNSQIESMWCTTFGRLRYRASTTCGCQPATGNAPLCDADGEMDREPAAETVTWSPIRRLHAV